MENEDKIAGGRITDEQGIIITAYTGVLMCDFAAFHLAVQAKLGRPVWSHEFAVREVADEIKAAFREDFMAILPRGAA